MPGPYWLQLIVRQRIDLVRRAPLQTRRLRAQTEFLAELPAVLPISAMPGRHIPVRIEFDISDRIAEGRRAAVGFADNHRHPVFDLAITDRASEIEACYIARGCNGLPRSSGIQRQRSMADDDFLHARVNRNIECNNRCGANHPVGIKPVAGLENLDAADQFVVVDKLRARRRLGRDLRR